MTARTCWHCGAPSVWTWGTRDYCIDHASPALELIGPQAWESRSVGIAIQSGPKRPDHGPLYAHVRCPIPHCGARWVGVVSEPCAWCERRLEVRLRHQHDLVLRAPDAPASEDTMRSWGERLRVAAAAGIITKDEAARAWRRAVWAVQRAVA